MWYENQLQFNQTLPLIPLSCKIHKRSTSKPVCSAWQWVEIFVGEEETSGYFNL
jgi:hypothetical protein